MIKITQKIVKLKKDVTIQTGMDFTAGTEFEIVADVVYMQGFPIPPNLQTTIYNWIVDNPKLFSEDHRRFK
jgi:hypothetical protein